MKISLQNLGKRFNREWIFRSVNQHFLPGQSYAITGPNGSGKSTLLQVIAGAVLHNEGEVIYNSDIAIPATAHYQYISIAAPYLELVEEMTATEMLQFHRAFKPQAMPIAQILENVQLQNAAHKQIRYFSSGMKQRLKLAQAFYSHTPVLLLDEPTSNLDAEGIALYQRLIKEQLGKRLLIISSNVAEEYQFCNEVLSVMDWKK